MESVLGEIMESVVESVLGEVVGISVLEGSNETTKLKGWQDKDHKLYYSIEITLYFMLWYQRQFLVLKYKLRIIRYLVLCIRGYW